MASQPPPQKTNKIMLEDLPFWPFWPECCLCARACAALEFKSLRFVAAPEPPTLAALSVSPTFPSKSRGAYSCTEHCPDIDKGDGDVSKPACVSIPRLKPPQPLESLHLRQWSAAAAAWRGTRVPPVMERKYGRTANSRKGLKGSSEQNSSRTIGTHTHTNTQAANVQSPPFSPSEKRACTRLQNRSDLASSRVFGHDSYFQDKFQRALQQGRSMTSIQVHRSWPSQCHVCGPSGTSVRICVCSSSSSFFSGGEEQRETKAKPPFGGVPHETDTSGRQG